MLSREANTLIANPQPEETIKTYSYIRTLLTKRVRNTFKISNKGSLHLFAALLAYMDFSSLVDVFNNVNRFTKKSWPLRN